MSVAKLADFQYRNYVQVSSLCVKFLDRVYFGFDFVGSQAGDVNQFPCECLFALVIAKPREENLAKSDIV